MIIIRMTVDFSLEIRNARRKWYNIYKELKEIRNEEEIQDIRRLRKIKKISCWNFSKGNAQRSSSDRRKWREKETWTFRNKGITEMANICVNEIDYHLLIISLKFIHHCKQKSKCLIMIRFSGHVQKTI